ncbi:MAG: alpha-galactosidase [Candidatus Marinimicrobia bacterium]|nr:alpha-galactosidase [Candidatus Neomarinimicrobiota bacterium]
MIKYQISILSILILGITTAYSGSQIEFISTVGESVLFKNTGIQLQFDCEMRGTVFYDRNGKRLTITDHKTQDMAALPSFHVVVNNTIIPKFEMDFDHIDYAKIRTNFGEGKRLTLTGRTDSSDIFDLEIHLSVELYNNFPNTAITYAEIKNNSDFQEIQLDTVYSNCYQLDASLVDSQLSPHAFYTFYGTAGRPSRQIEKILPENFNRENFTGRPLTLEGVKKGNGGIPVIDLWCKEMGIGIGHIETNWKNLYLPITVQNDGKVFVAIKEIPNMNVAEPFILRPGVTYKTVKSFINVHSLDFYDTIATYSELMGKQGVNMHTESTGNDYLSAWCSWNDYSTHAMASKEDIMLIEPILQRLPELKELNIQEIIFDAGWFNNQGDWMPNTDSLAFLGGEADLISSIDIIHRAGFKVKLWISYLTADPWSEVTKSHPDWMIKKSDGTFHLDRWSGYTMCPGLSEVQEYHKELAKRFVGKYGADGFKVDGMYVPPPCYNLEHHHDNPNESSEDYHKVFKTFYTEAKSINHQTTIMACPCGTVSDYTSLPYITETIAADPKSYEVVRRKAKLYRALKGANTPYSSDYIDITKGNLSFPITFATAIGVGAVPQTFYGEKPSEERMNIYKKWFTIYSDEMISRAEYLNLYDMHFDRPETHVFKKTVNNKDIIYFSFYADDGEWNGEIEFRGLDKTKEYLAYDYVQRKNIGTISGSSPRMNLEFKNYLLIKCIEN